MKKKFANLFFKFVLISLLLFYFFSCGSTKIIRKQRTVENISDLPTKAKFLKVHMKDGSLYVLDDWQVEYKPDTLSGVGEHYDVNRQLIFKSRVDPHNPNVEMYNSMEIPHSDIVLCETNSLTNSTGNLSSISIVGVPLGILTIYCLANPKACFGSCPTFYAHNGDDFELMAEGFSSSILPVFEKIDTDMLYWSKQQDDMFTLKLTNEALETHVIRYADLLVFPVDKGERVFATQDRTFYKTSKIIKPLACSADEGDILESVSIMDRKERFSKSDTHDLAKKETIEISFQVEPGGKWGLILGSRQTLLTTWLFYQSLAYTGTMAGSYAAKIENGDKKMLKRVTRLWDLLGGIEVYLKNDKNKWVLINDLKEMGPIAADVQLTVLPEIQTPKTELKLILTKGLWRIDYLALAHLDEPATGQRMQPAEVWCDKKLDEHTKFLLHDTITPLVTFPGDAYELIYHLPPGENFNFFLESKGYYLEWMRDEWLAEENPKKAALMFGFPGLYLKMAASEFKEHEPSMEEKFWGSRYVKH